MSNITRSAILASGLLLLSVPASVQVRAQSNPGYFIPPGGGQGAPPGTRPAAPPRPALRPQPPIVQPLAPQGGTGPIVGGPGPGADDAPQAQIQLPPVPDLPPMPRGSSPPAAVIGVLGIPDIMRASSAAQQVEKVIGERREKLNQDAQKEQATWRDLQQALANGRATMTPDQIRTREKELQDRITNAQRVFRDRNRIIQEAGQMGLAQIERMLIAVIRQVAESRGMNLVLHRAQVALNINEFDITEQVVEQMNKVLPSVVLPAEGASPAAAAAALAAATATPPAASTVAAPAPAAPTPPATAPAPTTAPATPATPRR